MGDDGKAAARQLVTVAVDAGVALVTLNRPEAMNALSIALRRALAITFRQLETDPAVRVVVLTGAGTRAFTAGLDLKELGSGAAAIGTATTPDPDANPVKAMRQCTKPVIGAINGVAITGGFELALACDILLASENARFADTHARIGIMPGWGLSQELSRRIGLSRAMELSLSGNFLGAEDACRWGLVNRVLPAEELLPAALQLARDIASADPAMVQRMRGLIREGYGLSFDDGMALEQSYSQGANARVPPEEIEARRLAVMARGRSQNH